MNKLVEHMIQNHDPRGNAVKIVSVKQLIKETGFTEEEIHHMTLEAHQKGILAFSRTTIKNNRWGIDQLIPGDIQYIGIYSQILRNPQKTKFPPHPLLALYQLTIHHNLALKPL